MGHAAGQLADRLHLLRLGELGLDAPPLGDVLGQAEQIDGPAAIVEDRHLRRLEEPRLGIFRRHALLDDGQRLTRLDDAAVAGGEDVRLVPRKEVVVGPPDHIATTDTEEALAEAVEKNEAQVVGLLHEEHRRNVLDHEVEEGPGSRELVVGPAEPLDHDLALAEQRVAFGTLPVQADELRHVLDAVEDPGDGAVGRADRRVDRAPVALLESATLRCRTLDVVFLDRHGIGEAKVKDTLQRGAEVRHAGRAGVVRIVREDLEEVAADDPRSLGHGGAKVGIARRGNVERRVEEQEEGRPLLEDRPVVGLCCRRHSLWSRAFPREQA